MTTSFMLGHLGLGDQIICNSIIRNASANSQKLLLPVKKHNILNIKDMLKDLKNIQFLSVSNDEEMLQYYNLSKNYIDNVIAVGIFGKEFLKDTPFFDESFYKQANIEYHKRWKNFLYIPDTNKQKTLLNKITNKYVFIHDDASRELNIKQSHLPDNIVVYRPNHHLGENSQYTIFDYVEVLKNAEEIHCMDSSFACLIDHIPELYNKKKYIHRYLRSTSQNPYYKNNWDIISE